MEERDVIKIIRDFVSNQFPKECKCCGKRYNSLAEYLRKTTPVGQPVSYDAEDNDWKPDKLVGTISISNCSCGSSMGLSSDGMNVFTLFRLMLWAKKEAWIRGITISDVLEDLRNKIDASVLQDEIKKTED